MADVVARAAKLRDVVRRLVTNEMERQRPRYKYAVVTHVDLAARRCEVQYPGDQATVSVRIGSIVPSGPGQVVRVDGLAGDRFVADVMGVTGSGEVVLDMAIPGPPTNLRVVADTSSLAITWGDNPEPDVKNGAGSYNVQVATDLNMTGLVRDVIVGGTYLAVTQLLQQQQYFVRVRAIDVTGNVGPWSVVASATTGTTAEATEIEIINPVTSGGFEYVWTMPGPIYIAIGPIARVKGNNAVEAFVTLNNPGGAVATIVSLYKNGSNTGVTYTLNPGVRTAGGTISVPNTARVSEWQWAVTQVAPDATGLTMQAAFA